MPPPLSCDWLHWVVQIRMYLETYEKIPYDVIRFLCGEINYGGRVTEAQDRELLSTLLEKFIHPGVIEFGHKFSPSGIYQTCTAMDTKSFLRVIGTYPSVPGPEIFGLHENADITGQQNATAELFATVLSMQTGRSQGATAGEARETQVTIGLNTDICPSEKLAN